MSAILEKTTRTDYDKAIRGPGRPRCDQAHNAILQAAFELLVENGYERFTIEAVAARSGAAKTTIYRWWSGKGALAMDSLLAHAEQNNPYPHTQSAIADIRTTLSQVGAMFAGPAGRVVSGILMAGQSDPTILDVYYAKVVEPRREGLRSILRRGVEQGEFRADMPVDEVAELLHSALIARLMLRPQSLRQPDWADETVELLLRGLAPAA